MKCKCSSQYNINKKVETPTTHLLLSLIIKSTTLDVSSSSLFLQRGNRDCSSMQRIRPWCCTKDRSNASFTLRGGNSISSSWLGVVARVFSSSGTCTTEMILVSTVLIDRRLCMCFYTH